MRRRGEIGVHLVNLGLDPCGRLSLLDKAPEPLSVIVPHVGAIYESYQITLQRSMHDQQRELSKGKISFDNDLETSVSLFTDVCQRASHDRSTA